MKPAVVRHPTRMAIMRALATSTGARSPVELCEELKEVDGALTLGSTAYHVRALATAGAIELRRQGMVRGAVEHFYALPRKKRVLVDVIGLLAELEAEAHRTRMALEGRR